MNYFSGIYADFCLLYRNIYLLNISFLDLLRQAVVIKNPFTE